VTTQHWDASLPQLSSSFGLARQYITVKSNRAAAFILGGQNLRISGGP